MGFTMIMLIIAAVLWTDRLSLLPITIRGRKFTVGSADTFDRFDAEPPINGIDGEITVIYDLVKNVCAAHSRAREVFYCIITAAFTGFNVYALIYDILLI